MAYLKNTKDGIRVYESYEIKDMLKENGYTFDGRGFWYKLAKNIKNLKSEYAFLTDLDTALLLPPGTSLDDVELAGLTAQEVATMAAQNPQTGIELMKKWGAINGWAHGPKSVPARETIF